MYDSVNYTISLNTLSLASPPPPKKRNHKPAKTQQQTQTKPTIITNLDKEGILKSSSATQPIPVHATQGNACEGADRVGWCHCRDAIFKGL